MKTKSKITKLLLISSLILPTVFSTNNELVKAGIEDDTTVYKKNKEDCDEEGTSAKENESQPSEPGNPTGAGDWTTPGSEANQVAQQVFDSFTKNLGTSGAFAAGIIANIAGESAFIPDRAETGPGGAAILKFGMDSKTPPPGIKTYPDHSGGGGLVQFTGFEKFTESQWWKGRPGTKGWDVENQIDAIWGLEFANKNVWLYASSTDPTYGAASYGITPPFGSLEEWLSTDDAIKSSQAFQVGYERPGSYHPEREAWAVLADELFNKDKVKADKSKWQFTGGNVGEVNGNSSSSSSGNEGEEENDGDCSVDDLDKVASDDIIKTALDYVGWFYYVQDHSLGAFKDWDNPPKTAGTDCSGYVWFILHKTGKYNVPEGMGWYTKTMEDDAKGEHKYLQEIKPEEAGPGTIVIVNSGDGAGNNGHTAFLTEQWKTGEPLTSNTTKIVQQGGGQDPAVNESTFGPSFSSLVSGPHTITFAKAVEKQADTSKK